MIFLPSSRLQEQAKKKEFVSPGKGKLKTKLVVLWKHSLLHLLLGLIGGKNV